MLYKYFKIYSLLQTTTSHPISYIYNMHFTLAILISLPLIANAGLISDLNSAPVQAPTSVLASGPASVPVPTAQTSSVDFPLDANHGELEGFPGKTSPLGRKRSRIEDHRRQFHNADFASSGSPSSSDFASAADADE